MFELANHEVELHSVNLRKEKHGAERKLGVDISVIVRTSNRILDQMEKGLRESLFRTARAGEQLDIMEGSDGLVAVKHPCLSPIKLDGKYPGYELSIFPLLDSGSEALVLVDVQMKDITIDPIEGGSVTLAFKLQVGVEPSELAEIGEYYTHQSVLLNLTPPKAQAQLEDLSEAA